MKFEKKKIYEAAIKAIQENEDVFLINDLMFFLPCGKTTFYELFHEGSDELNHIKELLHKNKVNLKLQLRKKMRNSRSPISHLALYRLICDDEERRNLNQQYIEQNTTTELKGFLPIDLTIKSEISDDKGDE